MNGQIAAPANSAKLGRLQADMPPGLLAPAAWLDEHGYYRQLLSHYVSAGWLESPAHGVYRRPGVPLKWQHVVASLTLTSAQPLHIGGATALQHAGFGHYVRMRGAETICLYGPTSLPAWVRALPLPEKFLIRPDAAFASLPVPRVWVSREGASRHDVSRDVAVRNADGALMDDAALAQSGLRMTRWGESDWPLVYATQEWAILEMLCDVPGSELVYDAHVMLQGMVNVRPAAMSMLLRHCASIKAKRLFLAMASRHRHAWFDKLDLDGVDLGSGKRALFAKGKLDATYQITLPADLDDYAR